MRLHLVYWFFTTAMMVAPGDFTPPKDGKLTEKQLVAYIAVIREPSKAAMSGDEYKWIAERANVLWPIAVGSEKWNEKARPAIEKQIKDSETDSATNQSRLSDYQRAIRDGTRVLTKDQRDAAVAAATADRDKLNAEVKVDQEALKPISDEIALHEKEDTGFEELAKNPPTTVAEKDRTAYIDARKNDAQMASDAAQNARDRLKEAQRNLDAAKARVDGLEMKIAHPEMPANDVEKSFVRNENGATTRATGRAIEDDNQTAMLFKAMLLAEPAAQPDPDNLALVKKHLGEYLQAIGAAPKPGAK